MNITLHINDISSPEAKAFLEYAKTLKFVSVDDSMDKQQLSKEELKAIEQARKSIAEKGGVPHKEVMKEMKELYPNAF